MRRFTLWLLAAMLLLGSLPCFARTLNLQTLPSGYVMTPSEVIDTFGHNVVKPGIANESRGALLLPDVNEQSRRRTNPAWLLFSNSPEILNHGTLPAGRGVLVSADVPAGHGRLLLSHSNQQPFPEDFVLRIVNRGEYPAVVSLDPRAHACQDPIPGAFSMDAMVGGNLAQRFFYSLRHVSHAMWQPIDGDHRILIQHDGKSDARLLSGVRGLGTAWVDINTNQPLHLALYAVPTGADIDDSAAPVLPRTGRQVRGLFRHPDLSIQATIDLASGKPQRYVFGGSERNDKAGQLKQGYYMRGTDTTEPGTSESLINRGDFGGITWFHGTVKAPPGSLYHGALLILVAGGRRVAVLPLHGGPPVVLGQWSGLVLGRVRVGQSFTYPFTLPPNSWAPVYLVAVPVFSAE